MKHFYWNKNFFETSLFRFSSVQSLSHVWLLTTPWTSALQTSLSITNSQSLPKLMSMELVMPSNHLILCHPLLLMPSIFPNIRVFSNESALCWTKETLSALCSVQSSSVTQSCLTLWPHGLQHARPPCPSPSPGIYANSSPLSWWCHPTISSSVIPFSCLQSFPASRSFPVPQFFASGGQSVGVLLQHQSFHWISRTDLL